MSIENLIAFNLVLMVSIASPGAAFLFALKTSVSAGRAAGIATGFGLASMAAVWTLAALLGLDGLFALFPWAYAALKIGGAFYLIYLAVMTWRGANAQLSDTARPQGRAFLDGILVNLGNPKSVLFAAAVIVVVFPHGLSGRDIALIVANHLALEVLFYSGFAIVLSSGAARDRYLRAKPVIDRIAATLLGALGLRLLIER